MPSCIMRMPRLSPLPAWFRAAQAIPKHRLFPGSALHLGYLRGKADAVLGCRQLELVQSTAQDPLVEEVASLTAELQEARKQAESARIAAGAAASEAKVARTGAQWAKDRVARLERYALRKLACRKARLSGCQHTVGRHLDVLWWWERHARRRGQACPSRLRLASIFSHHPYAIQLSWPVILPSTDALRTSAPAVRGRTYTTFWPLCPPAETAAWRRLQTYPSRSRLS